MAFTDPTTVHVPATGQTAPATWGTTVNTDLNWLHDVPVCVLKRTAVQSINDSSDTAIIWDSTDWYDPEGMFTTDNPTRITVPVTGVYLVTTSVLFAADADGVRYLRIYLNGANKGVRFEDGSANGNQPNLSIICQATAGQYFEVFAEHTAGAALDVGGASLYQSQFSVTLIRET